MVTVVYGEAGLRRFRFVREVADAGGVVGDAASEVFGMARVLVTAGR